MHRHQFRRDQQVGTAQPRVDAVNRQDVVPLNERIGVRRDIELRPGHGERIVARETVERAGIPRQFFGRRRVVPRHLQTVQIGDEPVFIAQTQDQPPHRRRIVDLKGNAHVHALIGVAHRPDVEPDVTVVVVAHAGRTAQPFGIVEVGQCPVEPQ